MDTETEHKSEPKGRLLSWLGLKRAASSTGGDPAPTTAEARRSLSREARISLLQSITKFLVDHDLDVSQTNLNLAYGAFSGANQPLARMITARQQSGEPIHQSWLNSINELSSVDAEQREMERMMARLGKQVETFQVQARQARNITVQYGSELEQHVGDLEVNAQANEFVADLAELARAMLDRTRRVEQDMRRSEEEVRVLRRNLARARREAEVDHLTGLPNRRAFEVLLAQQYKDARENEEALSVAFCDIDEFKRINDTHGHESGDRVIKVIAETLSRISNDRCHVARHGGEEFVMLFRGLTPIEAAEKLDLARESMAQRKLINRKTDAPFGQVTFSGGVADIFGYDDVRTALRSADEALYRAKEKGRNRIEIA